MITHAARETLKCLNTAEQDSYIRVRMSNQMFFLTFPISKELNIFLKKRPPRIFKLYQALFICKKLAADDDAYLGWGWSKI